MDFFLSVIGMVMIIEGLPYFAFPDSLKSYMLKIQEVPGNTLRIMGFVFMLAGLGLVYLGKG